MLLQNSFILYSSPSASGLKGTWRLSPYNVLQNMFFLSFGFVLFYIWCQFFNIKTKGNEQTNKHIKTRIFLQYMTFSIVLHTAADFYIKKLCFLLFKLICCCFLFLLCFVSERGWMFLCKTRQNNYNSSGIMIQMNMILKIVSNVNRLKCISIPLWPNAEKVYNWK